MTDSSSTEVPVIEIESDGGDGDSGPRVIAISLSDLIRGGEAGELPHGLTQMIEELVHAVAMREMAEELHKYVTPQIASEVLWCYGDFEGTTEPNLATAALVNLIRVAHISDEHIAGHLAEIDHFRGYVLGVCVMAETGDRGLHMLRRIAGLEPEEKDESEKP